MELVFKKEDHSFWLGDRRLPSVTQILSHFIPRYMCDEWYLERGKAVHKATELYDKDTLDPESVDPQIEGYLQAWIKFREDYQFIPGSIELQAYHPVYLYAGIIDRTGTCKDGVYLVDIKSGAPSKSDILQLAGYSCLVSAPKAMNAYLQEDGEYKVKMYSQKEMKEAKNVWLCFITAFNFLLKERIIEWTTI